MAFLVTLRESVSPRRDILHKGRSPTPGFETTGQELVPLCSFCVSNFYFWALKISCLLRKLVLLKI